MNDKVKRSCARRGVLLLLVLTVLSLFMLLGTTMIVMASRARTSARAFMAATSTVEASPVVPRAILDEALLVLIRGSTDPAVRGIVTESLLGDVYVTNGNRVPYDGEAFDAFGSDPFFTETDGAGGIRQGAFQGNRVLDVDNDADGVADGVWLDNLVPTMTAAGGGRLSFRVSYLVADLDGRINVNAHGGGGDPVGPASIDGSKLTAFGSNGWMMIQNGGTPQPPVTPPPAALRRPPVLGRALSGRGGNAYGLRLDRNAPRPASLATAAGQNPFTVGELERVLRPFDPDWSTLPPRLAAMLEDLDRSARWVVTTDSWDVTSKTGPAASPGATPEPKFDLSSYAGDKSGFAQGLFAAIQGIAGNTVETAQWVANVAEFRDPSSAAAPLTIGGHTVTGVKPSILRGAAGAWNGGFVSGADLAGVPKGDQATVQRIVDAQPPELLESLVASRPAILEAVAVPSRFAATIAQEPYREPGRVNVNTCSDQVWQAVCGGNVPLPQRPVKSPWELLERSAFRGNATFPNYDVRKLDRDLANRLGSAATVRSNVLAVWVTLEVSDSSATAGSPTCHRLFAIVDRSIPVEYAEGQNKDVRQTIRLKRFIN